MDRLLSRWDAASIKATCAQLARRPFEGDLSGFPFTSCGPIKAYRIKNSSLRGASFKNLSIRKSHFDDVDFTNADLTDSSDHGNEFTRCEFVGSVFRGITIGFEGTRFRDCTFRKVSFHGAGFVRPIFEGCLFSECTLRNIDFEASSFIRCKFVGEIRDVWFRNGFSHPALNADFGLPPINPMRDVDFAEATFWGVGFGGGVDLSTVIPPQDGQHRLYDRWPSRFAVVQLKASQLPSDLRPAVRKFIYAFEPSSARQEHFIINAADLRDMFGPKATEPILELLGP